METISDAVTKPKVQKVADEAPDETTKKEKVVEASVALNGPKDEFIKSIRNAAKIFKEAVEKELEGVEPGHPHYSDLKFARIRAERVLFNADELSRGKAHR